MDPQQREGRSPTPAPRRAIDPKQRIIVANKIADRALGQCVKLTPDRYKLPEDMMDDLSLATHQGRSVFDDADLDNQNNFCLCKYSFFSIMCDNNMKRRQ